MSGITTHENKKIQYLLDFNIRNCLLPYRKYILEKRSVEKKLEEDP